MQKHNEYKGFSLFNEIQDKELRTRNRAVILANITEDNLTPNKRVTPKGAVLILGYFTCIPDEEKAEAEAACYKLMQERGFLPWTH